MHPKPFCLNRIVCRKQVFEEFEKFCHEKPSENALFPFRSHTMNISPEFFNDHYGASVPESKEKTF